MCGLFEAGFCKVSEDQAKPFGTNLENVSKSYKFLGVSAEFLLQEKNFWKIVQQKTLQEDCYFQIILLDPDAKELVERHRKTEGFYQSTEALSHRLKTSITEIASFVRECDGKLQIRLYRELPIFRLAIVDDLYAFINFYGAKNLTGVQTPQIAFLKTEKSYFIAFKKYYDQIFAESTQYNI